MGVFATRDLPKHTFVAAYPGRVYLESEWKKLNKPSTTYMVGMFSIVKSRGKYAIDTSALVIDPSDASGKRITERYKQSAAPYFNEPVARQEAIKGKPPGWFRSGMTKYQPLEAHPNSMWVWNLADKRLEVWTWAAVRKGEELLLCYGPDYARTYETSCTTRSIATHMVVDNKLHAARDYINKPAGQELLAKMYLQHGDVKTGTKGGRQEQGVPGRGAKRATPSQQEAGKQAGRQQAGKKRVGARKRPPHNTATALNSNSNWISEGSDSNTNTNNSDNGTFNQGMDRVIPSAAEQKRECLLLDKKRSSNKGGWGLFAKRRIAPWQPLCVYPGRVFYNREWNLKFRNMRRTYAMGFFRVRPNGTIRRDVTIDPSPDNDGNMVDPAFDYKGPYVNEPSGPGEVPNAVWVVDVPAHKVMLYSYEHGIDPGQEVLACYGDGYPRVAYTSPPCNKPKKIKSRLQFEGDQLYDVDPTMGFQIMHPGMAAEFAGSSYKHPLDRVHPRGWYASSRMLKKHFARTPIPIKVPILQRTYNTNREPACTTANPRGSLASTNPRGSPSNRRASSPAKSDNSSMRATANILLGMRQPRR